MVIRMAFIVAPLKATTARLHAALYAPAKTTSKVNGTVRKHQYAMHKPTTPDSAASFPSELALVSLMA